MNWSCNFVRENIKYSRKKTKGRGGSVDEARLVNADWLLKLGDGHGMESH